MISHQDQPETDLREKAGFLCRWSLLAVAAGVSTAAAGIVTLTTATIWWELGANMILPDAIWRSDHGEPVHLSGYISRRELYKAPSRPVSGRPDGPQEFVPVSWRLIRPRVRGARVGLNRVVVRGTPYDALAFKRYEAIAVVVRPGTTVFLLDARLAVRALVDEPQEIRACFGELRRRGTVGVFHPGHRREFDAVREQLRGLAGDVPVLSFDRHPRKPMNVLWHAEWRLKHTKPRVVTADVSLAAQADEAGFPTWLISRGRGGDGRPLSVRCFDGLSKLKEYLGAQPIPQE